MGGPGIGSRLEQLRLNPCILKGIPADGACRPTFYGAILGRRKHRHLGDGAGNRMLISPNQYSIIERGPQRNMEQLVEKGKPGVGEITFLPEAEKTSDVDISGISPALNSLKVELASAHACSVRSGWRK